jgi:hypothetical protein
MRRHYESVVYVDQFSAIDLEMEEFWAGVTIIFGY